MINSRHFNDFHFRPKMQSWCVGGTQFLPPTHVNSWLILEAYDVILLIDFKMGPSLFLISRSVKALSPEIWKFSKIFESRVFKTRFFCSTKRVIIDQLPICSEQSSRIQRRFNDNVPVRRAMYPVRIACPERTIQPWLFPNPKVMVVRTVTKERFVTTRSRIIRIIRWQLIRK